MARIATITRQYQVVGVEPDMTRQEFIDSLKGTPVDAYSAGESYDRILRYRVSPLFCRWIFRCESSDGTKGICLKYDTKNPGNVRTSASGLGLSVNTDVEYPYSTHSRRWSRRVVPPSRQGVYQEFEDWEDGFEDLACRLAASTFPYHRQGADTIEEIIPIYAPRSDSNDPEKYIADLVTYMNRWLTANRKDTPTLAPLVALAAGHRNTSGGNELETSLTGELTEAHARALRRWGFRVITVTPDGPDDDDEPGDGMFPGSLTASSKALAATKADFIVEIHFEGAGGRRGVFVIGPDWGDDVDTDVRDRLAGSISKEIAIATGLPIRGNGYMSEKNTGVGGDGYRLRVFLETEPLRINSTRYIIEHGAHDASADLAIIRSPGFNEKAAEAHARALAAFCGLPQPKAEVHDPTRSPQYINGFYVIDPFWPVYSSTKLSLIGNPLSGMFEWEDDGSLRLCQIFERMALATYPIGTTDGVEKSSDFYIRNLTPDERSRAVNYGIIHGFVRKGVN